MRTFEWGFLVAIDLFLGGLSAGLFFLSALATLPGRDGEPRYPQIARYGAFLAPWPVIAGTTLLVVDLGQWLRFYKLMLHFRITSPMSIGSWLLTLFVAVSLLYLYSWLSADQRGRLFARLPGRLGALNRDWSQWRRALALVGLPLSLGVGTYTGVLVGALPARPFSNSSVAPQFFLASALSAGCAVLLLLCDRPDKASRAEVRFLYVVNGCLLAVQVVLAAAFVVFSRLSPEAVREATGLILGGPFTVLFWAGIVGLGLLAPIAAMLHQARPVLRGEIQHGRLMAMASVLVLAGAFALRCLFIFAGQASSIPPGR